MSTVGIGIASSVVDQTGICKEMSVSNHCLIEKKFSPVQVTLGAVPVLVYPVLQVQTTSLLLESCEQMALVSHPPLLTKQVSTRRKGETGIAG